MSEPHMFLATISCLQGLTSRGMTAQMRAVPVDHDLAASTEVEEITVPITRLDGEMLTLMM